MTSILRFRPLSAIVVGACTFTLLAFALGTTAAQAATISQQAYTIFVKEFRQQLSYSASAMQANLTATQTKLSSCATDIYSVSSSNVNAAEALSQELEDQFTADVAAGIDKPALSAFTALAKLHLPSTDHHQAVADETLMHRLLTLNTCSDLTRWQAANFSSSSEPRNTKEFGIALSVNLPGIDVPMTLATSEVRIYDKDNNKVSAETNRIFNTVSNDWTAYAQNFGF